MGLINKNFGNKIFLIKIFQPPFLPPKWDLLLLSIVVFQLFKEFLLDIIELSDVEDG